MAIDVCSEISSPGISPRISFSHDLNNQQTDSAGRSVSSLLDSTSDFDFFIGNNVNTFLQDHQLSSADELFSNGRILPAEIKKPVLSSSRPHRETNPDQASTEKKRLKEFLSMTDLDSDEITKSSSKSFWQFKRSNSLNCESTRSKSLIRSLHFLSRSNSTGSAPNPKPATLSKESQKRNLERQQSVAGKSSTLLNPGTHYSYNTFSTQKPPLLKKCGTYGSSNKNGVRISPVLNIPTPYISNATVNLFGFGSLFCNGKVKKKKR